MHQVLDPDERMYEKKTDKRKRFLTEFEADPDPSPHVGDFLFSFMHRLREIFLLHEHDRFIRQHQS